MDAGVDERRCEWTQVWMSGGVDERRDPVGRSQGSCSISLYDWCGHLWTSSPRDGIAEEDYFREVVRSSTPTVCHCMLSRRSLIRRRKALLALFPMVRR